jgi:hypothetical protein
MKNEKGGMCREKGAKEKGEYKKQTVKKKRG